MWVFTTRGFFSAVQHRKHPNRVLVRARTEGDIRALKDLIDAEPYRLTKSDYEWRIDCPLADWVKAVSVMATEIDYDNFKHAVGKRQGQKRSSVYMRVWGALLELEPGWRGWSRWTYGKGGKSKKNGKGQGRLFNRRHDDHLDQLCDCWMDADEGEWEDHDIDCPYAVDLMENGGDWFDEEADLEEVVQAHKRGSKR